MTGDGRTVVKANWGLYWGNPGTASSNPNGSWQKRHVWTDANGDLLWQPGEEGRLISSAGGVATTSLDPEQKDDYTYDMSVWLERELIANLGVRAGFVHRAELQRRGTINTNQPYDAFNIATSGDAIRARTAGRATADDGRSIPAFNLAAAYVGLPTQSLVTNVPGESTFDTWEIAMNKRMSNRWSASASYSFTSSHSYRTASNTYPLNPNSCINANDRVPGRDDRLLVQAERVVRPAGGHQAEPGVPLPGGEQLRADVRRDVELRQPDAQRRADERQPDGARQPDRHPDRPGHHDPRQPADAVLRSLQRDQQQRRAEHHGELGRLVAASDQHRPAAA